MNAAIRPRRRLGNALRTCVTAGALWAMLGASTSRAEEALATKFEIDDADPESSIPTPAEAMKAPLQMGYWVMLISERADAAEKKGELQVAARYYRALAKAVPDRRTGFARLCHVYQEMADRERALQSCKAALGRPGATVEDAVQVVRLVLAKESPLTPAEIETVDAVVAHLEAEAKKAAEKAKQEPDANKQAPAQDVAGQRRLHAELRCEIGTRLQDEKRLVECTTAMKRLAPGDARTLSYAFALAVVQGDFDHAKAIIERANGAHLPAAATASMKQRLLFERDSQSLGGRFKSVLLQVRRNPAVLAFVGIVLLALGSSLLLLRRPDAA